MALMDQPIPIDFGQGLDTKTDPKEVVAGRFVTLQNAIFTQAKQCRKRNGYTQMTNALVGGGTWSNPQMVRSYKNELVIAATSSITLGQRLFSYSTDLNAWNDQGKYVSAQINRTLIEAPLVPSSDPTATGACKSSSAIAGSITLYCYDNGYTTATNTQCFYTVVDNSTGIHLVSDQRISGGLQAKWSKAILLGASQLAILFVGSANTLYIQLVNVSSGGGVTLGSATAIGTCLADSGVSPTYKYAYDALTTSTGATIGVPNTPNINVYYIDTTGATTSSFTLTALNPINPIAIYSDSSNRTWVYWSQNTTQDLYFSVYNGVAPVRAPTLISATAEAFQIAAVPTSPNQHNVYYSTQRQGAGDVGVLDVGIIKNTANTSGAVGIDTGVLYGCDIYSRAIAMNNTYYMAVTTYSAFGSTGYVIDLADVLPIAQFCVNASEGVFRNTVSNSAGSSQMGVPLAIRSPSFVEYPFLINSTQLTFSAGIIISLTEISHTSNTALAVLQNETTGCNVGICSIMMDLNSIDAYQGIIQQDTLILNGGIVYQYDSQQVVEVNFIQAPDGITGTNASSGGNIGPASGTADYVYYVTYEWIDTLGNLQQSAPSQGLTMVFTGTTNKAKIYINPLTLSQKNFVTGSVTTTTKLWRTIANGQIAYLVQTITNSSNFEQAFVDDTLADSVIINNPQLYTQGQAIVENTAPPPSMILWTNNNRLWAIDSENPETTIDYSKTASAGSGIAFSTAFLNIIIDSKFGPMTGASPMDEKTVILKQNSIGFFIGDGLNDAGTGSSITNFQFLPTDAGCTNSKSVILYPGGILYRTPKGIYQVSRGLQTTYFGMVVEAFNNQDIRSAIIIGNRNQIRFLTSSGFSILYDYVFNQWSTFTNHQGYSGDVWQGSYLYARTDGTLFEENTSNFLDNATAFQWYGQTGWMTLGSVQGFQRARMFHILGDFQGAAGHGVQVTAAYDFTGSPLAVQTYSFVGSNNAFQYRDRLIQQKCDSIQLTISEITTGVSGEYMDLTNMEFMAGVKRGTNKVPTTAMVG